MRAERGAQYKVYETIGNIGARICAHTSHTCRSPFLGALSATRGVCSLAIHRDPQSGHATTSAAHARVRLVAYIRTQPPSVQGFNPVVANTNHSTMEGSCAASFQALAVDGSQRVRARACGHGGTAWSLVPRVRRCRRPCEWDSDTATAIRLACRPHACM